MAFYGDMDQLFEDYAAYTNLNKFGMTPDVSSGDAPEDVWDATGTYNWIDATTNVEVVSTTAADVASGSGASIVTISGLNEAWDDVTENVVLNGMTAVNATGTWRRIHRAYITGAVGDYETNKGTLTVRGQSGSPTYAQIQAGTGQTQMCIYTVPNRRILKLTYWGSSVNSDATNTIACGLEISIRKWNSTLEAHEGWRLQDRVQIVSDGGAITRGWFGGLKLPEKTDIRVRVNAISGNNRIVESTFGGALHNLEGPV